MRGSQTVLFPTIQFALFFALVAPVSWLLFAQPGRWRGFMIGASWFFYGCWDWRFVGLIIASTGINQAFAVGLHRTPLERRKPLLWLAVSANLALLGYFKYAEFALGAGSSVLRAFGSHVQPPALDVVLPVGISFITFQALSYVIDVGRDRLEPAPLADFAVYLAFFPHVVAGPIVRAKEFLPQLTKRPDPRRVDIGPAFWLIVSGLFKKVVIASYLADHVVDDLFASPQNHGGVEALVGVYAYAIQIFADFSGYTDIAIGLAALLGFRFPQNFNAPYTAASLQDFWRRWHMTLSRWLRVYLYIGLGGNRGSRFATYRNLFLTMLLGGLWHGAAWTFIVWGALHGAWLGAERFLGERRDARLATGVEAGPEPWWRPWVGRLITFHVVCLGWVFFRADSFGTAFHVLRRIAFHPSSSTPINTLVVVIIVGMLAAQAVPADAIGKVQGQLARVHPVALGAALGLCIPIIDILGPAGVAPFIYFQF